VLAQQLLPLIGKGRFDPPWARDLARSVHEAEERVRRVLLRVVQLDASLEMVPRAGEVADELDAQSEHPVRLHDLRAFACTLGQQETLFRELLRTSDIVTMHVPLNDSTRHMIGADELALMKPEAIVVNTSRGPVIDEVALTKALAENKLFGAGLDVFDQEPPPPDNPIFKLRNVVLTSHFAGPTWDNHVARFRNAFDNVQRVARGEKPLWVVPELAELMK